MYIIKSDVCSSFFFRSGYQQYSLSHWLFKANEINVRRQKTEFENMDDNFMDKCYQCMCRWYRKKIVQNSVDCILGPNVNEQRYNKKKKKKKGTTNVTTIPNAIFMYDLHFKYLCLFIFVYHFHAHSNLSSPIFLEL